MTTTTTHSIINSTNPNPARNYSNTQHNTTPTHTPITTKTKKTPTTYILQTLRHQSTAAALSTSTTPPLRTSFDTSPLPINPNKYHFKIQKCTLQSTIQTHAIHLPFHHQLLQLHLQIKFDHESRQTLHWHITQCGVVHH